MPVPGRAGIRRLSGTERLCDLRRAHRRPDGRHACLRRRGTGSPGPAGPFRRDRARGDSRHRRCHRRRPGARGLQPEHGGHGHPGRGAWRAQCGLGVPAPARGGFLMLSAALRRVVDPRTAMAVASPVSRRSRTRTGTGPVRPDVAGDHQVRGHRHRHQLALVWQSAHAAGCDAAALAGAIYLPGNPTPAYSTARAEATKNGYTSASAASP